ncbi:DUF3560 domain-containing protein, partial [Enterovibrio norvegicus]
KRNPIMAQQTHNPTRSNDPQATSVSPLAHESSPKNDSSLDVMSNTSSKKDTFLRSFTSQKLRKNAKKKIEQLLAFADTVILKTQSMGMDDCHYHNEPVAMEITDFWAWYEREYRDMVIYLTIKDGVLTGAKFCDCIYHFSNDVVMTFSLDGETSVQVETMQSEEEDAVVELGVVKLADPEPFIITHKKVVIQSIYVHWSESNFLKDDCDITLDEYERRSKMEARDIGRGNGYAKTKISITYGNGESETLRHDINADCPTLAVYYAMSEGAGVEYLGKPLCTFEQVKEALAEGYISPLNHDRKAPTPPEPENTRKAVSLGDYAARVDAKKDRLVTRAEKAQAISNERFQSAHEMGRVIPFGQPILIGHHSEGKHRRHIAAIDNHMDKSVEAQKKADYLEAKAESVGRAGIASDDPEAIQKLKEKLANLERSQEMMKAINKVIRSKHMTEKDKIEYMTQSQNIKEKKAKELLEGDFCGRVGFPAYALQNNNATIRTTKERIEELEKLHSSAPLESSGEMEGVKWSLFEEDGRIKFVFESIPSEVVRQHLKDNGFRWSRYAGAWVRKLTGNAVYVTGVIVDKLNKM